MLSDKKTQVTRKIISLSVSLSFILQGVAWPLPADDLLSPKQTLQAQTVCTSLSEVALLEIQKNLIGTMALRGDSFVNMNAGLKQWLWEAPHDFDIPKKPLFEIVKAPTPVDGGVEVEVVLHNAGTGDQNFKIIATCPVLSDGSLDLANKAIRMVPIPAHGPRPSALGERKMRDEGRTTNPETLNTKHKSPVTGQQPDAGGRIATYEDNKLIKVEDRKTGIIWEEYGYGEDGNVESVILYNPKSGEKIKCATKDQKNWLIYRQTENGKSFSEKEIGEFVFRRKLIDQATSEEYDNLDTMVIKNAKIDQGAGICKTIMQWTGLSSRREQRKLKHENAYNPKVANNSRNIFDTRKDKLILGQGLWADEGGKRIDFSNEEELQKILQEQTYIILLPDGTEADFRIKGGGMVKEMVWNLPDAGYTAVIEDGAVIVRNHGGEIIPVNYNEGFYWEGEADADKITATQLRDDETRRQKELATGHKPPAITTRPDGDGREATYLDDKILRSKDLATGRIWEEYVYGEDGNIKKVKLYNPVVGEIIELKYSNEKESETQGIIDRGRERTDFPEEIEVINIYKNGKDIGYVVIMRKKGQYITQTNVLIDPGEDTQNTGIGKTVKRWLALEADRETEEGILRIEDTREPRAAAINETLYDLSTLVISHGGFASEGGSAKTILKGPNKAELKKYLQNRIFSFRTRGKSIKIKAENGVWENISQTKIPDGYKITLEDGRLNVRDPDGKYIELEFDKEQSPWWEGKVDRKRIIAGQLRDDEIRRQKERTPNHKPQTLDDGTAARMGKKYQHVKITGITKDERSAFAKATADRRETRDEGRGPGAEGRETGYAKGDNITLQVSAYNVETGKEETFPLSAYVHGPVEPQQKEEILKVTKDIYKELVNAIIGLFPQNVPLIILKKLKKDIFGIASTGTYDFIALYKTLQNDPVALFHEMAEYLARTERLLLENEGDRINILIDGVQKRTIRITDDDAFNQIMKDPKDPHYLLRALQLQMFRQGEDKRLTQTIKNEQKPRNILFEISGEKRSISYSGPGDFELEYVFKKEDKLFAVRRKNHQKTTYGLIYEIRDFWVYEILQDGKEKFAGGLYYVIPSDAKDNAITSVSYNWGELSKTRVCPYPFFVEPEYQTPVYSLGSILIASAVTYMKKKDGVKRYMYANGNELARKAILKAMPDFDFDKHISYFEGERAEYILSENKLKGASRLIEEQSFPEIVGAQNAAQSKKIVDSFGEFKNMIPHILSIDKIEHLDWTSYPREAPGDIEEEAAGMCHALSAVSLSSLKYLADNGEELLNILADNDATEIYLRLLRHESFRKLFNAMIKWAEPERYGIQGGLQVGETFPGQEQNAVLLKNVDIGVDPLNGSINISKARAPLGTAFVLTANGGLRKGPAELDINACIVRDKEDISFMKLEGPPSRKSLEQIASRLGKNVRDLKIIIPVGQRHIWEPKTGRKKTDFLMNALIAAGIRYKTEDYGTIKREVERNGLYKNGNIYITMKIFPAVLELLDGNADLILGADSANDYAHAAFVLKAYGKNNDLMRFRSQSDLSDGEEGSDKWPNIYDPVDPSESDIGTFRRYGFFPDHVQVPEGGNLRNWTHIINEDAFVKTKNGAMILPGIRKCGEWGGISDPVFSEDMTKVTLTFCFIGLSGDIHRIKITYNTTVKGLLAQYKREEKEKNMEFLETAHRLAEVYLDLGSLENAQKIMKEIDQKEQKIYMINRRNKRDDPIQPANSQKKLWKKGKLERSLFKAHLNLLFTLKTMMQKETRREQAIKILQEVDKFMDEEGILPENRAQKIMEVRPLLGVMIRKIYQQMGDDKRTTG
ncbi:MAG: hypothetical protein PHW46_00930, partial [Candidatus Omnitrophica bacterium]|nr:hypothetical protein [Candidatus Omnitrophota bacterium]